MFYISDVGRLLFVSIPVEEDQFVVADLLPQQVRAEKRGHRHQQPLPIIKLLLSIPQQVINTSIPQSHF